MLYKFALKNYNEILITDSIELVTKLEILLCMRCLQLAAISE